MSRVSISKKAARALLDYVKGDADDAGDALAELERALKSAPRASKSSSDCQWCGSRREETAAIRDACYQRAGGVCECGCGRPVHHDASGLGIDWSAQAELDHVFSKGKGARLPQSVETCWILRADCHRERTNNRPDAAAWWEKYIAHCRRHFIAGGAASNAWVSALDAARARLAFVEVRAALPSSPRTSP